MTTLAPKSWKSVRDEVLRRITERVWQPGQLIPGEAELAVEFGCARTTVNRALRDLAESGIVTRRRRAGTRVAATPVRRAIFEVPIIRLEVEQRGASHHHAVLERRIRKLPRLLRGRLGLPATTRALHLRTMHFADARPYLYEDRWLNLAAVPAIADVDLDRISANEWLVRHAPFTHGDLAFGAANADELEAELLEARPGAAIFIAERITWSDDQPITHVRMAYPPGHWLITRI